MTVEKHDSLRDYLTMWKAIKEQAGLPEQARRFRFPTVEDLLLRHGAEYRPSAASPPFVVEKACYAVAYELAARRKRTPYVYVEGYGVSSHGIPVPHAWAVHRDRPAEVIEGAWREPGLQYFGIAFRPEFVRECHKASRSKSFGVLDAWWMGFPLLTGERRIEDVIWKG